MVDIVEVYRGANVAENISRIYRGSTLEFERSSLDPSVQALLDQAAIDGYTPASGLVLDALNVFVITLKSENIWDSLDVIWLPATNGDSDFATYNLKDPTQYNLTKVNSPPFTSLEGFTGDGSSAYLDTNWIQSSNGVNYTQNDASIFAYRREINNPTGTYWNMGSRGAGSNGETSFVNASTLDIFRVNRNDSGNPQLLSSPKSLGFFLSNRVDSSTQNLYINGIFNTSGVVNSASLSNINEFLLAVNNGLTPFGYSSDQFSFFGYGSNITSKQSEFYNAIQTYMTTLGTEV